VDWDLRLQANHGRFDISNPVKDRVLVVELLRETIPRPSVLDDAGEVRDSLSHRGPIPFLN
jgi:hypothetical protein